MTTTVLAQLLFRRGTGAEWGSANTILGLGEPGWSYDQQVLKVGDGHTPWSELNAATLSEVDRVLMEDAIDAAASINREQPNGVAGLDAAGKLTSINRLPDAARTENGQRPVGKDELVINPADHGAAGDGTTNDYTALATSFNLAATTHVPVDLEEKTYKFNSRLIVPAGVTVRNGGLTTTLVTSGDQGAIDVNAGNVHFENVRFSFGGSAKFGVFADQAGAKNITIKGGTATGASSHAFAFNNNVTDSEISGVTLTSVISGIRVRGACQRVVVARNVITDWWTYGVEFRGISGAAPKSCTADANYFTNPTPGRPAIIPGEPSNGMACQSVVAYGVVDTPTNDLYVTNNTYIGPGEAWVEGVFAHCSADQFVLHYVDGFEFSGNTSMYGGENGVSITHYCKNGTVFGNKVAYNDGHGIEVGIASDPGPASGIVLSGNAIYNNGQNRSGLNADVLANVWVTNAIGTVIVGNELFDDQAVRTVQYGVLAQGSPNTRVAYNNADGCAQAISAAGTTTTYAAYQTKNDLRVGDGLGAPAFKVDGAAGSRREVWFQSGSSSRWRVGANATAETGGNAGSKLTFERWSDTGTNLGVALDLDRVAGKGRFYGDLQVDGVLTATVAGTANAPVIVTKGSDQPFISTTTLATVTNLSAVLAANAFTEVKFYLYHDGDIGADARIKPVFPAGSTGDWFVSAGSAATVVAGTGTGFWLAGDEAAGLPFATIGTAGVGIRAASLITCRVTTTTAGSLTLQYTQNVSTAVNNTVFGRTQAQSQRLA